MKVVASELYRVAYNKYIELQGECPHWDFETPEGNGCACCQAMLNAQAKVRTIGKSLKR